MSPQSENAHLSCSSEPREFSLEERKVLLNLAHEAIDSALEARAISLIPPSPHLAEPRGVFTTLYHRGGLRGCVGYIFPTAAVIEPWRKPPGQQRLKIHASGRSLPTKLRNSKFPSVSFPSSSPFAPRKSKLASTAY